MPLAHAFINAGFRVLGYDLDEQKVDRLKQGESYINHVPANWIASWLEADKFDATTDPSRLAEADALLMCVPTPLSDSRDPDLSYVVSTVQTIAKILRPGQLIVLESTTYPGTTRDVVLKELAPAGLEVGKDFFLAYSPEREDPGNPDFSASKIPKVVGGYDEPSLQVATALYETAVTEVVPVSSCEVAEACKILENTYRAVNIALVNELKMLCDRIGIDVWEVIDAAKSKPFGFSAFYPGPGLGGHCIPIDPFYLSWVARKHGMSTKFIELAGEINSGMPEYVIRQLVNALNSRRQTDARQSRCRIGSRLQAECRRPARKSFVCAHRAAARIGCRCHVQRPAHPTPTRDAASPRSAGHGQLGAHSQLPVESGLRVNRHESRCLRLRFYRQAFAARRRHPQCDLKRQQRSREDPQGVIEARSVVQK